MRLDEYLSGAGAENVLAKKIGVSVALIFHYKSMVYIPTAYRACQIELATGGAVTRKDLRPDDWFLFWPELAKNQAVTTEEWQKMIDDKGVATPRRSIRHKRNKKVEPST